MRALGNRISGKSLDDIGLGHQEFHVTRRTGAMFDGGDRDATERVPAPFVIGQRCCVERRGSRGTLVAQSLERTIGLGLGDDRSTFSVVGDDSRRLDSAVETCDFVVGHRRLLEEFEPSIVEFTSTSHEIRHLVLDGLGFAR